MATEFFMQKFSDHMEVGRIVRWLAEEGESVEQGQVILEIETDKAAVEVEAPASGVLKGIRPGMEVGADVPVGETMCFIAERDEAVPALPPLASAGEKEPDPASASPATLATEPATTAAATTEPTRPRTSPAVRRLAKDLGIDLTQVVGSGPNGRIRRDDVLVHSKRAAADGPAPVEDEDVEWSELTQIQQLTGERMLESVQSAPQFGLTVSVDMTDILQSLEDFPADSDERPSVTIVLIRVAASALRLVPRANASFEAGRLKLHKRIHIGVAVGSEKGLVVPVIKDADQKSMAQISQELKLFQEKAVAMRFGPEDLSGATFTISNLGMYGVDHFNAILNPPQSAILAVGRIIRTPTAMPDDSIAVRPIMRLTLSVDHRVMDGIEGANLLTHVKSLIEQPTPLL